MAMLVVFLELIDLLYVHTNIYILEPHDQGKNSRFMECILIARGDILFWI
jgi:hypothetical protein